ncbi:MAG: helix-turn-helix domain-containing protein [Ruminococcus sp.]|nr:helix-turn-helix domain-containing protein [Ruminococcus sp.]
MNQEKIGKFISKNRKKGNLTQEQLAEKLNVSKNAVSKWERGLNLPDASLMPKLCEILNITLNELFSGEEIPDNKYKEIADNNLLNALENNVFTLKERIDYFKKKWENEHFLELTIVMLIIVFFIILGFVKDNDLQYLFMILGFIYGIIENNRLMAYIENNAYKSKLSLSSTDFKNALKSFKETKKILKEFKNKEEAINYLMRETKLSKKECTNAYEILIKLDLNHNILKDN